MLELRFVFAFAWLLALLCEINESRSGDLNTDILRKLGCCGFDAILLVLVGGFGVYDKVSGTDMGISISISPSSKITALGAILFVLLGFTLLVLVDDVDDELDVFTDRESLFCCCCCLLLLLLLLFGGGGKFSVDGVSLVVDEAELMLLEPTPLDVDEETDESTATSLVVLPFPFGFVTVVVVLLLAGAVLVCDEDFLLVGMTTTSEEDDEERLESASEESSPQLLPFCRTSCCDWASNWLDEVVDEADELALKQLILLCELRMQLSLRRFDLSVVNFESKKSTFLVVP